jgi:STE24 endopeptidase
VVRGIPAAAALGVALLLALCLAGPAAPAAPAPAPAAARYFTPQEIARGRAYTRGRNVLALAGLGLRLAVLALLVFTPLSAALRDAALAAGRRPWAAALLYAALALALLLAARFPLALYGGFLRERAWGMATQSFAGWLADYVKGALLLAAIVLPAASGLWALIRAAPRGWPWVAAGATALLAAALTFLAPVVIDPLFHSFRPLRDPALEGDVRALAARAGLPVDQVLEADASRRTTKTNAYFTGLGGTRRIVLYDTLVRAAPADEVRMVVAHEMGHWRHHHIWKGIGLGAAAGLLAWAIAAWVLRWAAARPAFRLAGPGDLAGLALILLVLAVLDAATLPLQNAVSRAFEREADRTSLELTGDPGAFIRGEITLARTNLADVAPPRPMVWLLYTHPPVLERIAAAEAYAPRGR